MIKEITFFNNESDLKELLTEEEIKRVHYRYDPEMYICGFIINEKLYDSEGNPITVFAEYIRKLQSYLFNHCDYSIAVLEDKTVFIINKIFV